MSTSRNVTAPKRLDEGIDRIAYEHVFIYEHDLFAGRRRFDPDYQMAQSWQRMRSGTDVYQHDRTMLLHEAEEAKLMRSGVPYARAHVMAVAMGHNFEKELQEWLKGGGVKGA